MVRIAAAYQVRSSQPLSYHHRSTNSHYIIVALGFCFLRPTRWIGGKAPTFHPPGLGPATLSGSSITQQRHGRLRPPRPELKVDAGPARVACFARPWSLQSRPTTELVLQALLAAVWRRKPKHKVIVHSDQGSKFTSIDWSAFPKAHNIEHSMSRRGNCHDNAVAESFFNLLKRERVRRRLYKKRDEARKDIFDYIEMFYNLKRKYGRNGMTSPIDYGRQQKIRSEGV